MTRRMGLGPVGASALLLLGLAAGCARGTTDPDAEQQAAALQLLSPPVPSPAPRPAHLDAQGRLKGSGRHVDWFEIPAGFEEQGAPPRRHLFVSRVVTMAQLREYLGARMLTGQVDELGKGAIYRAVMPLSAAADAMRFDVQVDVVDGGKGVSVSLEERSFFGVAPLSPAQAAKVLAEEQARAE